MADKNKNENVKKKGFFDLFKGGCCNIKIVPKEESGGELYKGGCCDIKVVSEGRTTGSEDTKS